MKKNSKKLWIIVLLFSGLPIQLLAQDIVNDFQLRTSVETKIDIGTRFQIFFEPELRWQSETFVDRFMLSAGADYKIVKGLKFGAQYNFIGNRRVEKSTIYLHRFKTDLSYQRNFKQWQPKVVFTYSNYAYDNEDAQLFRYKAVIKYDIKESKFSPVIGFEVYHQLNGNFLYKYRFQVGFDYKLNKKVSFGADYKLDYYLTSYRNRHILDLTMKLKLNQK